MLLFYTIKKALAHLKHKVSKYEKDMNKTQSKYEKRALENIIEWLFERGLSIIAFSKPNEVDQETIDYFLGRNPRRPDIKELKQRLNKDYEEWLSKRK